MPEKQIRSDRPSSPQASQLFCSQRRSSLQSSSRRSDPITAMRFSNWPVAAPSIVVVRPRANRNGAVFSSKLAPKAVLDTGPFFADSSVLNPSASRIRVISAGSTRSDGRTSRPLAADASRCAQGQGLRQGRCHSQSADRGWRSARRDSAGPFIFCQPRRQVGD